MSEEQITIPYSTYATMCNLVQSSLSVSNHMKDFEKSMTITGAPNKIAHFQGCLDRTGTLAKYLHCEGHHIESFKDVDNHEIKRRIDAVKIYPDMNGVDDG